MAYPPRKGSAKAVIFIDGGDKAHHFPEYRADLPCSNCGSQPKTGYGFAGGGMGIYTYCDQCGMVVTKTCDPEEDAG